MLTGFTHGYKAAIEPVITTGKQLVNSLRTKIDNAQIRSDNISATGYKAVQIALYLGAPTVALVMSYPAAIAGVAYGLGRHLGLDIVDLFRVAKAKLTSNSLTPQKAARIARKIQEATQELEEHIAALQKKARAQAFSKLELINYSQLIKEK